MLVNLTNDVIYLEDGTYTGTIQNVFEFYKGDNQCIGIEFALKDDKNTVFTKFYDEPAQKLGEYSWNTVFRAINSNDMADLVGHDVEFTVKNNTKNGVTYSNIKKIKLIQPSQKEYVLRLFQKVVYRK